MGLHARPAREHPPLRPMVEGRRFVVTGSEGFLGRRVVEILRAQGAQVVALARSDCDLRDGAAVSRRLAGVEADSVVHLAGIIDRTRDFDRLPDLVESNLLGTQNLLRAVRAPVVHTGTLEEYGPGPAPLEETQAAEPRSPYALSKMAAGALVCAHGGLHVRLSLVYGPGQGKGFFLPQLLEALRSGQALAMTPGEQVRDFLWLDDAAEGLIRLTFEAGARPGVVNLCTGVGTTLRDVVALLGSLAGRPVPVRLGAMPYRKDEVFHSVGSPARLAVVTGWRPGVGLEEGLRRMLEVPVRGV